jgi:hypothetical protein
MLCLISASIATGIGMESIVVLIASALISLLFIAGVIVNLGIHISFMYRTSFSYKYFNPQSSGRQLLFPQNFR